MAGTSITLAPSISSFSVSAEAWARARVTTKVFPKRGLVSNQLRESRSFTTSPTINMAGGFMPVRTTSSYALSNVVTRVRCSGWVPQRIRAAGVSAGRPFSINLAAIFFRFSTPMRKTSVSTPVARPFQLMPDFSRDGSSWPVITAKLAATFRWVTGMPAYSGTEMALVMPGTNSKGRLFSFSSRASSPPRPKTKESPPFRRATVLPSAASLTNSLEMSSCFITWLLDALPT